MLLMKAVIAVTCMHALMLLSVAIDGTAGGASGANIEVNE